MVRVETGINFEYVNDSDVRYTLLQGGTRSGKTYSVLQWIAIICLSGNLTIDIFRKWRATHQNSLLRDFEAILNDLGIKYQANKSELRYYIGRSVVTFCGADDPQKLRGASRDIAYINEANELTLEDFDQIDFRTKQRIVCDFNPSMMRHWLYELAKGPKASDVVLHKTTFRDNLWLPPSQVKAILDLQYTNPAKWKVYGEGEAATAEEIIYPLWDSYETAPENTEWVIGLDFGFKAQTAAVMVGRYGNQLYVKQLIYQSELTTSEIAERLKPYRLRVYADAAEPDRISELVSHGLDVHKGRKDVQAGIAFVHEHQLFIHQTSNDVRDEVQSYVWKRHADGSLLDEPVKKHDHLMDAMRYAVYTHWGHPLKFSALENKRSWVHEQAYKNVDNYMVNPSDNALY